MIKKNCVIATIMAVLIFVITLSSSVYTALEADHDCCGEHCPICQQIAECEYTRKQLSIALIACVAVAALVFVTVWFTAAHTRVEVPITLITLKVKLSN